MDTIEHLAIIFIPPLMIVALGLPMAWLWRRTILLRGRRRRMGPIARTQGGVEEGMTGIVIVAGASAALVLVMLALHR